MQLIQEIEHYPKIDRIFALVHERADAVFLDSSLQNELGRYSIIALHPYLKLVKGETFTVNGEAAEGSFEDFVRTYLRENREENHTELPLTSGAVGYFSYDYGRKKEGVKTRHESEVKLPDSILIFYDSFVIEDHEKQRLYLIANGHGQDCREGMSELLRLVREAEDRGTEDCGTEDRGTENCGTEDCGTEDRETEDRRTKDCGTEACETGSYNPAVSEKKRKGAVRANFTKEGYMDAISRMIQYIIEGDIYIANMTQQLQIESEVPPYEMFERLRKANPSPFGGYFHYGDFQVVCASPERFLQMKDRRIQTRPIKGTRKRGNTPEEDAALRRELELSEKDKSELLMIVDLERNDLNRVCVPGSVKVTELFTVEAYATVFHLISNIVGELRPELTVMELLEAAFPGGSITGAPKLRAMEIIDELEHGGRNLYTGSMGYLSLDGDCDFNIVIRTAVYQDGVYHLGVGGGITYESELEFEYEETLQKAKALLKALDADGQQEGEACRLL